MIETCEVIISNSDKKMLCDKEDYLRFCYEIGFRVFRLQNMGYCFYTDNNKHILLHRWVLGFPEGNIDHINGDSLDNRKCNLRLCTQVINLRNLNNQIRSDNKTGVGGVSYCTSRLKYVADLRFDGKTIHLGRFDTIEEATEARKQAESDYWGVAR